MSKKEEQHIRFRHYHIPELAIASVTLAVRRTHNEIEGEVSEITGNECWEVSWAVCQPEDNFSREVGRNIALATMEERGVRFVTSKGEDPFRVAIRILMNSNVITGRDVRHFRWAMVNLLEPEAQEELTLSQKILGYLYERLNVIFMSSKR